MNMECIKYVVTEVCFKWVLLLLIIILSESCTSSKKYELADEYLRIGLQDSSIISLGNAKHNFEKVPSSDPKYSESIQKIHLIDSTLLAWKEISKEGELLKSKTQPTKAKEVDVEVIEQQETMDREIFEENLFHPTKECYAERKFIKDKVNSIKNDIRILENNSRNSYGSERFYQFLTGWNRKALEDTRMEVDFICYDIMMEVDFNGVLYFKWLYGKEYIVPSNLNSSDMKKVKSELIKSIRSIEENL